MPLYNTASAVAALDVPQKWMDNLLSHNKIDGVSQARQGVPRRLTLDAVVTINLIRALSEDAGIPVGKAVDLAHHLMQSDGPLEIAPGVLINLKIEELRGWVLAKLANAVEFTPHPARGRPRSKEST